MLHVSSVARRSYSISILHQFKIHIQTNKQMPSRKLEWLFFAVLIFRSRTMFSFLISLGRKKFYNLLYITQVLPIRDVRSRMKVNEGLINILSFVCCRAHCRLQMLGNNEPNWPNERYERINRRCVTYNRIPRAYTIQLSNDFNA